MTVQKEVRTAEQVLEILSGTPLAFLVKSLQYRLPDDFDFETSPIVAGEVVIGEMTEIEKIFYAATMHAHRDIIRVANENNDMVAATLPETKEEKLRFEYRVEVNKSECRALSSFADAFNNWCWRSIKQRIGIPATEPDGLGIRDGCVITSIESSNCPHPTHHLAAMLGTLLRNLK